MNMYRLSSSAAGKVSNRLMSNYLFFFTLSSCLENLESDPSLEADGFLRWNQLEELAAVWAVVF